MGLRPDGYTGEGSALLVAQGLDAFGHARLRVFRLRREPVLALQAWLDQLQAHWNEQLGAFKRYVEEKEKS